MHGATLARVPEATLGRLTASSTRSRRRSHKRNALDLLSQSGDVLRRRVAPSIATCSRNISDTATATGSTTSSADGANNGDATTSEYYERLAKIVAVIGSSSHKA